MPESPDPRVRSRRWAPAGAVLLLLAAGLGAQTPNISFQRITSEHGLPQSTVSCILQDREGLMWFGTQGGLARFDGYRFTVYKHDRSLSSDAVNALFADPRGDLWIGTQGSGLDRLTGLDESSGEAVFKNYSERDGLPNNVVYGIRAEASGRLWLSTNHGLARFDPGSESFETYGATNGLQANEFNAGAHHRLSERPSPAPR